MLQNLAQPKPTLVLAKLCKIFLLYFSDISLIFMWYYCDISVVFLWYSCDIPVIFLWHFFDIPVLFLWYFYDISSIFLWYSYDIPVIFLWYFYKHLLFPYLADILLNISTISTAHGWSWLWYQISMPKLHQILPESRKEKPAAIYIRICTVGKN